MTLELRFLPLHLDKEGVGAKTSGSGECPFSDVRSLSTAPLVPPKLLCCAALPLPAGRVPDALPINTQVRGTCSPAPAAAPPAPSAAHRSLGPKGPHTFWGPRPNGPSTSLGSLSLSTPVGTAWPSGTAFVWNQSFGRSRFPLL